MWCAAIDSSIPIANSFVMRCEFGQLTYCHKRARVHVVDHFLCHADVWFFLRSLCSKQLKSNCIHVCARIQLQSASRRFDVSVPGWSAETLPCLMRSVTLCHLASPRCCVCPGIIWRWRYNHLKDWLTGYQAQAQDGSVQSHSQIYRKKIWTYYW